MLPKGWTDLGRQVVLFCGGLGTRIREYSESVPKPMIPLGHEPILRHVMQYYSDYAHDDFILVGVEKGLQLRREQLDRPLHDEAVAHGAPRQRL